MTTIRRPGGTSAVVLVVLTASVCVAHLAAPEWVHQTGLDVWNAAADRAEWRTANERRLGVEAQVENHGRRREAAAQVVARLVAGELALPAAADELAELFPDEGSRTGLAHTYPDAPTDRHRFALSAMERTERLDGLDPGERKALIMRLEAEYRMLSPRGESSAAAPPPVARIDEVR